MGEFISGTLLFDETICQRTKADTSTGSPHEPMQISGIKVDKGAIALATLTPKRMMSKARNRVADWEYGQIRNGIGRAQQTRQNTSVEADTMNALSLNETRDPGRNLAS